MGNREVPVWHRVEWKEIRFFQQDEKQKQIHLINIRRDGWKRQSEIKTSYPLFMEIEAEKKFPPSPMALFEMNLKFLYAEGLRKDRWIDITLSVSAPYSSVFQTVFNLNNPARQACLPHQFVNLSNQEKCENCNFDVLGTWSSLFEQYPSLKNAYLGAKLEKDYVSKFNLGEVENNLSCSFSQEKLFRFSSFLQCGFFFSLICMCKSKSFQIRAEFLLCRFCTCGFLRAFQ